MNPYEVDVEGVFELQSETIWQVASAGIPPLQGRWYVCTIQSADFLNLGGTAVRIISP